MLASFRPGLLVCAALTATYMVPAQAGPSAEPLLPMTSATIPQVPVPELLDPDGQPQLSEPQGDEVQAPSNDETPNAAGSAPVARLTGELADMVAKLRDSAAGTHELECLA